jgi:hypothetical protein
MPLRHGPNGTSAATSAQTAIAFPRSWGPPVRFRTSRRSLTFIPATAWRIVATSGCSPHKWRRRDTQSTRPAPAAMWGRPKATIPLREPARALKAAASVRAIPAPESALLPHGCARPRARRLFTTINRVFAHQTGDSVTAGARLCTMADPRITLAGAPPKSLRWVDHAARGCFFVSLTRSTRAENLLPADATHSTANGGSNRPSQGIGDSPLLLIRLFHLLETIDAMVGAPSARRVCEGLGHLEGVKGTGNSS